MNIKNINHIIKIVIIATMYLVGFLLLDKLPNMVPTHWNVSGVADSFSPKNQMIWFFPTLTLAIAILFKVLPKLDPKKEKYSQFSKAWEAFQLVFIIFFAYIYFVSLYAALNSTVDVGTFVLVGVGVMFVLIGNYMGKIRQNYFVGIKTPWTLNNEEVWNKTHRLGGWCFVIAGLLFIVNGFVQIYIIPVFIAAIVIAAIIPIVYSYLLHRNLK